MNSGEFLERLGIDAATLQTYLDDGLPFRGSEDDPEFDDSETATWLVRHGKVELDPTRVACSMEAAAGQLGIGVGSFHRWAQLEGFPGRPSYYPLAEIKQWHDEIKEAKSPAKEKGPLSIKEQRDLLKLREESGLLVEVVEVNRIMQLSTSYAVAELNLISGKFESRVPAGTDEELVAIMRDIIQSTVREACTILSEMEMDFQNQRDLDSEHDESTYPEESPE